MKNIQMDTVCRGIIARFKRDREHKYKTIDDLKIIGYGMISNDKDKNYDAFVEFNLRDVVHFRVKRLVYGSGLHNPDYPPLVYDVEDDEPYVIEYKLHNQAITSHPNSWQLLYKGNLSDRHMEEIENDMAKISSNIVVHKSLK